jgi:prepilin-type N-terminal cleavage/methylation domain-containing protein
MSNKRSGFTLVELLVAVTIFVLLFGLGAVIDSRSYRRASLESERDAVVNLLARARNQAMNNVHEANHGFAVTASDFVVYEGPSYASRVQSLDESFPRTGGLTLSGSTDVNFRALDGVAASSTIEILNEQRSSTIIVNSEGMIEW